MKNLDNTTRTRKLNHFSCLLVAISISFVGACTKAPSTISDSFDLGADGGYLTDAKARVIISQDPSAASRPGAIHPRRITCIEPHPDVASTVANSFGVGLSLLTPRSGSLSKTEAEGLAQIAQRTVSIQTLQRLMFRACEAYANGAITGTGYSLLLSEINKTMVTLVLAETAGARFGQAGASLGGTSSALASAKIEELTNLVNELEASQEKVSGAAASLEQSAENAAAAASAATADDQVTPPEAKVMEDANQEVERDTENLQDSLNRLKRLGEAVTLASSGISTAEGLGSLDATPDPEVAAILASMQQNFLSEGKTQNYISACLVELGMGSDPIEPVPDNVSEYRVTELLGLLKKLKDLDAKKLQLEEERTKIDNAIASANAENSPGGHENKLATLNTDLSEVEKSIQAIQNQINRISQLLSSSNLVDVQNTARAEIDKLAKKGSIEFGDLRAFVYRIYHLNRKTGLFSHCRKHLKGVLEQVHDFRQNELQHDVTIREKMVDAAVGLASSIEDSDAAKFAFCHLLPDAQVRRECISNLRKLTKPIKIPPPSPKPAVPPQKQEMPSETADVPGTIAITQQDLNRLKAALPELIAELTRLDAFKGDKIAAPVQESPEQLADPIKKRYYELIENQTALKKALLETSQRAHLVRSTVAEHVDTRPTELDELLASYNAAVAERERVDDNARKFLDVRIESFVKQAGAIQLLTTSRVKEVADAKTDVSELITKIEQHNAGVAAFKQT